MSNEAYDVVIVGAGAAGCVVASYLAEHSNASIALIEADDMPAADYETAASVFKPKQLADLTIVIGMMNDYNRMAISFRVPPAAAKR